LDSYHFTKTFTRLPNVQKHLAIPQLSRHTNASWNHGNYPTSRQCGPERAPNWSSADESYSLGQYFPMKRRTGETIAIRHTVVRKLLNYVQHGFDNDEENRGFPLQKVRGPGDPNE